MQVRELEPREVALFRELRLRALSTDPDAFGETRESAAAQSEQVWRDRLARECVPGRKAVLIVEFGGDAVAMCLVGLRDDDPTTGYLGGMFVRPSHRRRGVGASLLDAAEAWLERLGAVRVRAAVAAPNDAAVRFYRRQGYAVTGELRKLRKASDIPVLGIRKGLAP